MAASSRADLNRLCFDPLLDLGTPNTDVIQTMVQEVEDELEENSKQIEECVREILQMATETAGPNRSFISPADALQFICDEKVLENACCVDPDTNEISKLLKQQMSLLETQPGSEEEVLQQLLKLSSAQGLCLPVRASTSDPISQSSLSINMAMDDAEQLNQSLWDSLSHALRKGFLQRLSRLPLAPVEPSISTLRDRRLRYVQSIAVLFPAAEVWTSYRSLRNQQVEKLLEEHVRGDQHFQRIAEGFVPIADLLLRMVTEDFELLNSGVFGNAISVMRGVYQLYYEPLLDEIANVMDVLQDELPVAAKPPTSPAKRKTPLGKVEVVPIHKSASEQGALQFKTNLRRHHSTSLDSLISRTVDGSFTDLQNMSPCALEPLSLLVTSLLKMEAHFIMLRNSLIWEVSGTASSIASKPKPKGGLKSALKSTCKSSPGPRSLSSSEYSRSVFSPKAADSVLPDPVPPPFGATQAMIAELSASLKVVEKPYEESPRWEWRGLFRKLMPEIAKSLENQLQHAAGSAPLMQEWEELEHGTCPLEGVRVDPQLVGGRLDYPQRISKGLHCLISLLDAYMPLASAGSEGCFVLLRSSFVDTIVLSFKNLAFKISKVCHAPSALAPQDLYLVLASAAFVRNHLMFFEQNLGLEEASRRPLSGIYKQYCELVEGIARQVIEMHTRLLQTSLLHDAESNNWTDSKDFYEMWQLHLRALRSDLWRTCPPKLAQSIFSAVMDESLVTLSRRYATTNPSHARSLQFRADIVAILMWASENVFSACASVAPALQPSPAHKELRSIHHSCCHLLAVLAYVCSPLDLLARQLCCSQKAREKSIDEERSDRGHASHWMHWIRPHMFPLNVFNFESFQTTTALQVQLLLVANQPDRNLSQLLWALHMRDHTLSILLATQVALAECNDQSVHQRAILDALFEVLALSASQFPDALARVVLPVIERTDSWELFDCKTILGKNKAMPLWLESICQLLTSHIIRFVRPAVLFLMEQTAVVASSDKANSLGETLPCGCKMQAEESPTFKATSVDDDLASFMSNLALGGNKDMMAEALYLLLSQVSRDAFTLPASLMTLFHSAQDNLEQKGVTSPHQCMAFKVIATCIRRMLCDDAELDTLLGSGVSAETKDAIKMLGECTYHLLTASSFSKNSGTPRVTRLFAKANRPWVSEQIELLKVHFSNEVFDLGDSQPSVSGTQEFTDTLMASLSAEVQSTRTGEISLNKLYNFVLNNLDWLGAQLDWCPALPCNRARAASMAKLTLDIKAPVPSYEVFNPLEELNSIGDSKLSQSFLMTWEPDWSELLQADLGVTEVGVASLVRNRPEFQDATHLQIDEKRAVERLCHDLHLEEPDGL